MLEIRMIIDNEAYYKCNYCGYDFGTDKDILSEWNYCPICGEKLA